MPLRFFVGALYDVAEQKVSNDNIVHLNRGDGFDQSRMAGVDQGTTFSLCLTAGSLIA